MRGVARISVLVLAGCYPDFESIEAACPESLGGSEYVSEGGATFYTRLNCYRRYVNLADAWVGREVQQATRAHADYLDENGILDPTSPRYGTRASDVFEENSSYLGSTGRTSYDRLVASGAIAPGEPFGLWAVFYGGADLSDPGLADAAVHDPWFRDALFQPWWRGGGIAEFEVGGIPFAYLDIVYSFPPSTRMDWPIVYPKDGQVGLPTGYQLQGAQDDPLGSEGTIGYPISITVGSFEADSDDSPFDLVLQDVTLIGPDGEEEPNLRFGGPGRYTFGSVQATVVVAASQPLLPNATYTLDATITWKSRTNKRVTATFTTGDHLVVR